MAFGTDGSVVVGGGSVRRDFKVGGKVVKSDRVPLSEAASPAVPDDVSKAANGGKVDVVRTGVITG